MYYIPESPPSRVAPDGSEDSRRTTNHFWPLATAAGLVCSALVAGLLWFVTVPYYAMWPGPIVEVVDYVEVENGPTVHPLNGDLYLLTVSLQEVNAFALVEGWLDPVVDVVPRDLIRPEGVTPQEHRERNLRMMDESMDSAILAALDYLGVPVTRGENGVLVVSVLEDGPAAGILQPGDLVVAVERAPVDNLEEATDAIGSRKIGDMVVLSILREDERYEVEVTLAEHMEVPGRPMVGVSLGAYTPPAELPFEIDIDRATSGGGPSAGMMYALGLIDLLTEEDLVRGNIIAGTGTISSDGHVGPVGGIRQKVVAARNAGARYILVPEQNYPDAVSAGTEGVEIMSVSSIEEAVEAVRGIPV
ncbi:MAG: PDZ domain-containing protein [Acidimicrobiia bacterium]|nr:PDZ domain-containing protein [Acidimicrobiia bacterium]MYB43508.1 PDZ domain-containing protein [Acidimicrobiia bacterium]MYC85584.1 PDZ domain-containing protein [Acidimicrobiia bacterium]